MELLQSIFGVIGDLTWGWALIPFLVILGLFFTVATGFVQFRYFFRMFRVLLGKNQTADPNRITAREALYLSIGGRVGGGNIAGVAVAITLGGPGAVFWMWAIAVVGMATSLIECSLAQLFKEPARDGSGSYRGGPARIILHGLGQDYKWLAVLYAICLIAAFGIGFPAFQGNTVGGAVLDSLNIPRIFTAVAVAAATAYIVWGGIRRIARACDIIVPVMAFVYIVMALIVIGLNITEVPAVFSLIIKSAFGFEEVVSGGMGAAIAQGLRRGLFSNEAGLGSAPNVAATAEVNHPISQGITQSLSVFVDTIIICSCTAFVILLGSVYVPGVQGIDGVALTQQSLVSHLGTWVQYFLTFAVMLFAFSSIIYNYYLGENALTVMSKNKQWLQVFKVFLVAVVFLGAVAPGATDVFFFSDPMMGILAVVNLMALLMLFPIAKRLIVDFSSQLKKGVERPVLNPNNFKDLDINRKVWTGKAKN